MANELATAKQEAIAAFSDMTYTGHDLGSSNGYPPIVNVIQSDKQFKAFGDEGDSITAKMYGQLFIRTEKNKLSDLCKEVSGTLLKIERGWEAYDETGKVQESGHGFIDSKTKDMLNAKYGSYPKNMIKLLFAPLSFADTKEKLATVSEKLAAGQSSVKSDYPFVIAVVKGDGFESWFGCEKEMKRIASEEFGMSVAKVPTVAFKLVITSKKVAGERSDYYVLDFKIEENDPIVARQFIPFVAEVKEQSMFYKVKEKIEYEENATKTLEDISQEGEVVTVSTKADKIAQDFEDIDAQPESKPEETTSDELEDLPF